MRGFLVGQLLLRQQPCFFYALKSFGKYLQTTKTLGLGRLITVWSSPGGFIAVLHDRKQAARK
jgi:hypothetical protein